MRSRENFIKLLEGDDINEESKLADAFLMKLQIEILVDIREMLAEIKKEMKELRPRVRNTITSGLG